jgi:hypothetical protein
MLKTRTSTAEVIDCPALCGTAVFVGQLPSVPRVAGTSSPRVPRFRLLEAAEVTEGERWTLTPSGTYAPKVRPADGDEPGYPLHWARCARLTPAELRSLIPTVAQRAANMTPEEVGAWVARGRDRPPFI